MKPIKEQKKAAADWWQGLQPYWPNDKPNPTADKAALARLRRGDLIAAATDPATMELLYRLGRNHPDELLDVALCAAVLAGVRKNREEEHPARSLGPLPGEPAEQAKMKPLRFRRLIEAEDSGERLTLLRRAVQLAGGNLNVTELAAACLDWSQPRRQRWIFEYYAAGRAAPACTALAEAAATVSPKGGRESRLHGEAASRR
jgi:CRISPR system Cascade subunit CasB